MLCALAAGIAGIPFGAPVETNSDNVAPVPPLFDGNVIDDEMPPTVGKETALPTLLKASVAVAEVEVFGGGGLLLLLGRGPDPPPPLHAANAAAETNMATKTYFGARKIRTVFIQALLKAEEMPQVNQAGYTLESTGWRTPFRPRGQPSGFVPKAFNSSSQVFPDFFTFPCKLTRELRT